MSLAVRLHRFSTIALVALVSVACTGPAEEPEPALSGGAEAACRAALRDVRTWCSGGIRESSPGLRYNCLDARLRFDQNCYPG